MTPRSPQPAYWVDNLGPFLGPHWGNLGIRYYGLAYVLGFLTAAWLLGPWAMIAAVAAAVVLLCWRQAASSSAKGVHSLRRILESIEPVTDDAEETGL